MDHATTGFKLERDRSAVAGRTMRQERRQGTAQTLAASVMLLAAALALGRRRRLMGVAFDPLRHVVIEKLL